MLRFKKYLLLCYFFLLTSISTIASAETSLAPTAEIDKIDQETILRKKHRHCRDEQRRHRGPTGPTGPTGPQGSTGLPGPVNTSGFFANGNPIAGITHPFDAVKFTNPQTDASGDYIYDAATGHLTFVNAGTYFVSYNLTFTSPPAAFIAATVTQNNNTTLVIASQNGPQPRHSADGSAFFSGQAVVFAAAGDFVKVSNVSVPAGTFTYTVDNATALSVVRIN